MKILTHFARALKGFLPAALLCGILAQPLGVSAQKAAATTDQAFISKLISNVRDIHFLSGQDGKMLVAGGFNHVDGKPIGHFGLMNSDGSIAPTFNEGKAGADDTVHEIIPTSDGKYYLVGSFKSYNGTESPMVVRITATGERDATFVSPFIKSSLAATDVVNCGELLPDGKLLLAGRFEKVGTNKTVGSIVRLNADGTVDATFNSKGAGANNSILCMLTSSDGKVILGGNFSHYNTVRAHYLARINADGSHDASFTPAEFNSGGWVRSLLIDSKGKLIVAGEFTRFGDNAIANIVRLSLSNGSRDDSFTPSSFGKEEICVWRVLEHREQYYLAIAEGMDGAGKASNFLGRLNADGTQDQAFFPTRPAISFANSMAKGLYNIFFSPQGELYVTGNFTSFDKVLTSSLARIKLVPKEDTPEVVKYNDYVYTANFEDVVKDNYDEGILTINGVRWKFVNAKIETDKLRFIPEGKKAVSIKAFRAHDDVNNFARIEMLDDLPKGFSAIAFEAVASGQDGIFAPDGWFVEVSTDQGKTWRRTAFSSPARPEQFDFRLETFEPARIRIAYAPPVTSNKKRGQRLLIDNLRISSTEDFNVPAVVMVKYLYDGYETSNDYITFTPDFRGNFGMADPDDPNSWDDSMFNSYVEVRLDGVVKQKIGAISEDLVVKLDGLSIGKHVLEVELKHVGSKKVWGPKPILRTIHFEVKPHTTVKGLDALRKAEVGKFYEVLPLSDKDTISINWQTKYRAQKYLLEGKRMLLVDDPQAYNLPKLTRPDKKIVMKRMRVQAVDMDFNRMFRLDNPMQIDTIAAVPFTFLNFSIEQFTDLKDLESYMGAPISIEACRFAKEEQKLAINPNSVYKIRDWQGNYFDVYMAYADLFFSRKIISIPEERVTVFGILSKSFSEGKPCLIPLFWEPYTGTKSTESITADGRFKAALTPEGKLYLTAPGVATAEVFNLEGAQTASYRFTDSHTAQFEALSGTYVIVIKADNKTKAFKLSY